MTSGVNSGLSFAVEPVIDPDLPICDPHHHLWYQSENPYQVEDFLNDISGGHRVLQTVFIESRKMLKINQPVLMQPVSETEFVHDVCTQKTVENSRVKIASGIVGYADLASGDDIVPVLEAHIEAGKGRFRGIRYTSTWNASPVIKSSANQGILTDSKFRKGFALLRKYNLSFDAWLYHPQLSEIFELARAYPDTSIILDHAGGPLGIGPYANRREEVFKEWKQSISALAKCQNVSLKLGGFGMELCGFGWGEKPVPPGSKDLSTVFAPYFLECIEKFGVKRCMFESNFPVDKKSFSYTVLWNAFKLITKDFSSGERRALFFDTAVTAYRLQGGDD